MFFQFKKNIPLVYSLDFIPSADKLMSSPHLDTRSFSYEKKFRLSRKKRDSNRRYNAKQRGALKEDLKRLKDTVPTNFGKISIQKLLLKAKEYILFLNMQSAQCEKSLRNLKEENTRLKETIKKYNEGTQ